MSEWKWYFDQLMSEECLCEKTKRAKYSFCYGCYKALPADMQKDLYKRLHMGYEQAVDAAVKYLQENVW